MSMRPHGGHPDPVLADALLNGAVTSREADLISHVHLDQVQRTATATSLGLGRHEVDRELATAERRLVNYLDAA